MCVADGKCFTPVWQRVVPVQSDDDELRVGGPIPLLQLRNSFHICVAQPKPFHLMRGSASCQYKATTTSCVSWGATETGYCYNGFCRMNKLAATYR
jgi:hypothetical protein